MTTFRCFSKLELGSGIKVHAVGADLDHILITRAKEKYSDLTETEFHVIDAMDKDANKLFTDILAKHKKSKVLKISLINLISKIRFRILLFDYNVDSLESWRRRTTTLSIFDVFISRKSRD